MKTRARRFLMLMLLIGMAGCATTLENAITMPRVELSDVRVVGLGFNNQTFLLTFAVANPNPFPLPVNDVRYGVKLDGQLFASGHTPSEFSVPAEGNAQFAISVELDLLRTAPRLLTIVRQSTSDSIRYELEGEFGLDIPLAPPIGYRHSGTIRVDGSGF